jgi:hypothetical protein
VELFNRWKNGDADAGQEMAQRFSDWYFALSAARFGEKRSRESLERACQLFAQGIASVENGQELEIWAFALLDGELEALGDPRHGVDEASRLTGNRLPSRLLRRAVAEAECPSLPLLALTWSQDVDLESLKEAAEEAGGYPKAILEARYELKHWLNIQETVPFAELPDEANLDYLPLPLYEAGRLSPEESRQFEYWMLDDESLRKDVTEFSSFSLAMRSGILEEIAVNAKRTRRRAPTAAPRLSHQVPSARWSPEPWTIVLGACVLAIVAALLTLG